MILLQCSNCQQTLEIDDAFAGGVCRCRHCGTIQTVPADAAKLAAGGEQGAGGNGQKAATPVVGSRPLYRREEQAGSASGLDELAGAVAGSGMLSSGLSRTARRGKGTARPASRSSRAGDDPRQAVQRRKRPADRRLTIAVALAALMCVVAAGFALALVSRGNDDQSSTAPAKVRDATFAGLPLGRRVVFVLDRGVQTQPSLRALNEAVLDAISRLPVEAQFQVVYWANPDAGGDVTVADVPALPGRSLRDASEANRAETARGMDALVSGGSTDVGPALDLALRNNPDTIVLATGKAWQLDASFADNVLARLDGRAERPVIHAVTVGNTADGLGEPMRRIARDTAGEFRGLTTNQLRELASR